MVTRKMLFMVAAGLSLAACTPQTDEERRRAMIQQAQQDAAAESQIVADSLKFLATFVPDTVDRKSLMVVPYEDDNGDQKADTTFYVIGRKTHQFCLVNTVRYNRLAPNDTISCQWVTTLKSDEN
jgi:hypothetical protein